VDLQPVVTKISVQPLRPQVVPSSTLTLGDPIDIDEDDSTPKTWIKTAMRREDSRETLQPPTLEPLTPIKNRTRTGREVKPPTRYDGYSAAEHREPANEIDCMYTAFIV